MVLSSTLIQINRYILNKKEWLLTLVKKRLQRKRGKNTMLASEKLLDDYININDTIISLRSTESQSRKPSTDLLACWPIYDICFLSLCVQKHVLTDNYKKQHILLDSDKKYTYCN